jgi:hypothetical protein
MKRSLLGAGDPRLRRRRRRDRPEQRRGRLLARAVTRLAAKVALTTTSLGMVLAAPTGRRPFVSERGGRGS